MIFHGYEGCIDVSKVQAKIFNVVLPGCFQMQCMSINNILLKHSFKM